MATGAGRRERDVSLANVRRLPDGDCPLSLSKLSFSRELVFLFRQGAERIQKKIDEQLFFF